MVLFLSFAVPKTVAASPPQVLPPWGRLYHWQTRELGPQTRIPWRDFFDVESIARFVPAVDLDEYLGETNAKNKLPT